MPQSPRSYTSLPSKGFFSEFRQLLRRSRSSSAHIEQDVKRILDTIRAAEQFLFEQTGFRAENKKILEIGPGQFPRQLAYFASKNDATAIDLDVIPAGFDLPAYFRLLKQNGPKRLAKTIARKILGFDRQFNRQLARQLNLPRLPRTRILQMDATKMTFPDNSFDFVYSFDVFEHFPDPAAVIKEISRILRPGGCSMQYIHPWTAEDGSHDLRISALDRANLPYWPHLRSQHQDQVQISVYLNRLSLAQWRDLFAQLLPDCSFLNWKFPDDPRRLHALSTVRAAGELSQFTDEALLTDRLLVVWQKTRAAD
jgi:SAM-dependent methyltransferase